MGKFPFRDKTFDLIIVIKINSLDLHLLVSVLGMFTLTIILQFRFILKLVKDIRDSIR